jgi:quinoprotein glucose dehydrogenase
VRRILGLPLLLGIGIGGVALAAGSSSRPPEASLDPALPALGTQLAVLPSGPGKEIAESSCLNCHSTDIIRQQRLTEAQWTASVKKMTGWGAAVPEEKKDELVQYLASHFGPDNDSFEPVVTRPVGR